MIKADVAIVGAGPGGSTLAKLLAASGYSILLLEAGEFPRDKVCGDFLSSEAMRLLVALGCEDLSDAPPIRSAELWLDGQVLSSAAIPGACAIARVDLDERLARQAVEAGACLIEGCRVGGVEVSDTGVEIAARRGETTETYEARLVIGADGARSIVARAAGLANLDRRHTFSAMRGYATGLSMDRSVFLFESDVFPGYGWLFPMGNGKVNYGAGVVAEASSRSNVRVRDLLARVELAATERFGGEPRFDRPVGWPIHAFASEGERYFDRGLLIGEAGGFVDPINGEGIAFALVTAGLAAVTIDEAFDEGDFSGRLLRRYETRWREHLELDLQIGRLLVTLLRNRHLRDVWLGWLRVVGLRAQRDASFAQQLANVMAGAAPNRVLLEPLTWFRTITAPAELGRFLLHFRPDPSDILRVLVGGGETGAQRMREVFSDAEWLRSWLSDLLRNEIEVARAFR